MQVEQKGPSREPRGWMVRDEEALWKAKGIMQRGRVTVISRVFTEKVPEYIFSIHVRTLLGPGVLA